MPLQTLQDRISALAKLDAELMLQNDRIGKASQPQENKVLTFKPVDEELLKEYNEQFPKGFEYIDTTGTKKYRKFMIPQDAPTLDNPVLQHVLSDVDYQNMLHDEQQLTTEILQIEQDLIKLGKQYEHIKQKPLTKSYTKSKMKAELKKNNDDQRDIMIERKKRQHIIHQIHNEKTNQAQIKQDNELEIATTTKNNQEKIQQYKDELNILNKNSFTTEQLPSETEEQYYQRLRLNAETTEPDEDLENAKLLTLKKFKQTMKEIIRSDVKIEQICNELDPFNQVDNKLQLLKRWPKFKTEYEKIYGLNNSSVSVDDIIAFIKLFIISDGEIEYTKIKELLHAQLQEHQKHSFLSNEQLKELQHQNILSNEQLQELKKNTKLSTSMIIPSPPPTIHKQPTEIKQDIKNELLMKYPTFDLLNKRLEEMKLDPTYGSQFNTILITTGKRKKSPNELALNIATLLYKYETMEKIPKSQIGFGIKTDNIPETIHFGKVLILLHKLYYNNILSVKYHNKINIPGFKNVKVSDKFVKIIMNTLSEKKTTTTDINSLSTYEKQIYDRLIYLANLNKKLPNNKDKTISELKHRLKLIEGEIESGNNSELLIKELYEITYSLKDFGILSKKNMLSYLSQFK
jgi:hypothetical protein